MVQTQPQREELYMALRLMPAMVCILRGPKHIFEFANQRYLTVVGRTADIIGEPVAAVFPELAGQGIVEILDGVYQGKAFLADELQMFLDTNHNDQPESVYFNFSYQPMPGPDGAADRILVHAVEVSEQVRARQVAQQNEEQYRMLLNSIDEGFCLLDMVYDTTGKPVDYRFVEVNRIFEKQTGLKGAVGKTARQLIPDLEQHWIDYYDQVATNGKSRRFTSGSEVMGRWFDVHASRVGDAAQRRVALLFKDITQQKRADQERESVTRRVTDVLESMGDAFFMLDKDWHIVQVNKVHEKVTQTKRKDILGKNFWEVFPAGPESKYWIEHHKVMRTRKPSHFEEYYEPLQLWTETHVYPARDGGISVFFHDITVSKQAQQSADYQKMLMEAQLAVSPLGIAVVGIDGRIKTCNQPFLKMWNFEPDATPETITDADVARVRSQLVDPETYTKRINGLYRRHEANNEQLYFTDGRIYDRYGTPMYDPGGNYHGYIWYFQDVTEQHHALQALQDSEAHFRFMAESLSQLIFTAGPDGTVDYVNPQWASYTGAAADSLVGGDFSQFVHPADLPAVMATWQMAVDKVQAVQLEVRMRRADGLYRRFIGHVRPMCDEAGAIVRWFGSMTDIEDIHRTTAQRNQLKKQRSQLIALNAAKDEFISLASHQLRTPATGVKQYLGMVLDGFAGDVQPDQQAMLDKAYASNERQITIINDLLKVASVDAGKVKLQKQPTKLGALLMDIIADQAAKFVQREQVVKVDIPDGDVVTSVDPDRMRMVLDNIIDNASKYTTHGKNISLAVSRTGSSVEVAIADQGVGIDAADIDKLFHKFSRLDNPLSASVGGTGLGLYWAKKIIDLHGGTISVASVAGTSTVFTIKLPLA